MEIDYSNQLEDLEETELYDDDGFISVPAEFKYAPEVVSDEDLVYNPERAFSGN